MKDNIGKRLGNIFYSFVIYSVLFGILFGVGKCTYDSIWGEEEHEIIPQLTEEERAIKEAEMCRKMYVEVLIDDYRYVVLRAEFMYEELTREQHIFEHRDTASYTLEDYIIWCCGEESMTEDGVDAWVFDVSDAKAMIKRIRDITTEEGSASKDILRHLNDRGIQVTEEERGKIESLDVEYEEEHGKLVEMLKK